MFARACAKGETPLHVAVAAHNDDVVLKLLAHIPPATIDERASLTDETALEVAVRVRASDAVLGALLDAGADASLMGISGSGTRAR